MRIIKKLAIASCVAAALATSPVYAEPAGSSVNVSQDKIKLPKGVTLGPTVEGITEYRLANGLRVVLFPDASKATATVNMTYLVGSRHENYGETGMAHLLEHLMFKGSKNYPEPTKEFTRRGFRMNGSTWLDRTNYYVTFTATEDNLNWALGWSADAMRNSFIARKDLDTEMTVVRNEYEMGENSPNRVMMKRMQSVLYDWHNYGKSTIGNRSDIENVEIENLQAFYHRYYRPDNAVLTVSGKFDVQKTLDEIAKDFGSIENPKEKLPPEWTVEPTADGSRLFEIRRKGETQFIAVGYRIPSALHPDMPAVEAAVDVLSDNPNGRLYSALVKTGLATNVFRYTIGAQKPGFVMFGALVKKGEDIEPVRKALIETIESSLEKQPVSQKELERFKTQAETEFEMAFSDPESFAIGLSEFIALGDWRLFFFGRDQIAKVTALEADKAAQKYFVRDNRVVGVFIPDDNPKRAEITQAPTAEQILSQYKPKQEVSQGEDFDSGFDNLNARTERLKFGDLEIALLPKKTRNQTVTVMMNFESGDLKSLNGKEVAEKFAMGMVNRGTKDMTFDEIADKMTQLKMQGAPTGFITNAQNLPEALKFSAKLLKEKSIPDQEFDRFKKQLSVMIQSSLDKPEALAREAIGKHFNTYPKGDPRYSSSLKETLEDMEKLTPQQVRAFHDEVMGTARGQIAIVGDFDPKVIKPILEKDFGSFKSKAPFERIYKEYKAIPATRIVIDTPEKENATIVAKQSININEEAEDALALKVANWILGSGSGLSNRLIDRLRQKEGLSYGAGSGVIIPQFGNNGSFSFQAIVAPQNLLKAENSAKDVIETAWKDGFTEKEVQEAIKGILQAGDQARAQDSAIAGKWLKFMKKGQNWNYSKEQEERLKKLTVAEVNAAFRKYINPKDITWVLAGDQSKVSQ